MSRIQEIREALQRIRLLESYHRRLSRIQEADGTWDWWLDREIAQLRKEVRRMMREGGNQ